MSSSVSTDRGLVIISQVYPQGQNTLPAFAPQTQAGLPASHFPQMSSSLKKFQKGEPKALGVVQIMLGQIILILGVLMTFKRSVSVNTASSFWGSIVYIISGAFTIAADKLKPSLISASLSTNVVSAVSAGFAIITNCVELHLQPQYSSPVIVIQYAAQPQPVTQNASDTQYQLVSNTDVSSIPKIPPPAHVE